MNTTIQSFKWVDRDTAARDLLQVAYHAPEYISEQAWSLLSAIDSPAILPELRDIAVCESNPHTHDALDAISAIPGNIFFPDFAPSETAELDTSRIMDLIGLLKYHPINQEWVLPLIDYAPSKEQPRLLWLAFDYLPDVIAPRLLTLYDQNVIPFTLNEALRIYHGGHKDLLEWLEGRWDEIIYLCLIYGVDRKSLGQRLFRILDQWPELKADLLRRCPIIQEEIEQQRVDYDRRHVQSDDVQATPQWKKMQLLYERVMSGDENAFRILRHQTYAHQYETIPQGALAIHLIGKLLPRNVQAIECCLSSLRYDQSIWFTPDEYYEMSVCSPIRYEAALALSDIATPAIWEAMVEAYFMNPTFELKKILHNCVVHLTDQLSGIVSYPKELYEWDVSYRPWFRVFTKPDPESKAMYAEYYGRALEP